MRWEGPEYSWDIEKKGRKECWGKSVAVVVQSGGEVVRASASVQRRMSVRKVQQLVLNKVKLRSQYLRTSCQR